MADRDVLDSALARGMNRRRFIRGIGLGAAGLAFGSTVACSGTTTDSPSGGATATGGVQPTSQPVSGGILTVVHNNDLSPSLMINGGNQSNFYMMTAIYDRLMHCRTDRLEMEPELAESWKFGPDFSQLTLKLRPNVKFHTGKAFTAEDVKWNVQRGADPKVAFQAMGMCQWVQKMDIPDPLTITFTFDKPRPSFLDVFEILMIGEAETYQDGLDGKRFVGTGPFIFKEWQPGDHYTVVRNPDYWIKGRPYVESMTVKVIPAAQTRLINLQTGASDVAIAIEPRDGKELQKDKNYVVMRPDNMSGMYYLGIDLKAAPFGDKRVRQAMAYLIDRQRIFDTQLMFGQVTQLPWDKTSPAYDANLANKFDYNPAKAKELLAQAGVGSNVSMNLFPSQSTVEPTPMGEIFQAELAKLGWKADLVKLAVAEGTQKLRTGTYGGLWITNGGFMHMNPSTFFLLAQYVRVPNGSNFDTPEYRKLIDDMASTADQTQTKKLYDQMNQLFMDECFICPIAASATLTTSTAKIKDLKLSRGGMPILANVWKSK